MSVALVTGGSRGIGKAITQRLMRDGYTVAITYVSQPEAAYEVGADMAVWMDLGGDVMTPLAEVEASLGPIDILVNNGAMAQEKPVESITSDDWSRMMAVNLRGPFMLSQAVAPSMARRGFGRLIHIASIGGQWGGINQVHYAIAKGGLITMARSFSRVYSGRGVTSNAVSPGLIMTDMASREIASGDGIPAGTVEDVAAAVSYLASDDAGYVTGQTIGVNGGALG